MLLPLFVPEATSYNLKSMQVEATIREEKLYFAKLHSSMRKKVPECTCYSCMEGPDDVMPDKVK